MDTQQVLYRAEKAELRIVLVGKTGAGKSASGNTILGRKAFKASMGASSLTSECQKETGQFEGQALAVVDTPGLYDTRKDQEEVRREIARCVSFAAPGPHVFLVVLHPFRLKKEEQKTVKILEKVFGEAAASYTVVLFTHGDYLEEDEVSIEESISGNSALSAFIHQCGGRYHVFNNRSRDPSQVRELLWKINTMVQRNGGGHFTNEMLQEARQAILEAMIMILRENVRMKFEEGRRQAERKNKFIHTFLKGTRAASRAIAGLVAGAAIGSLGGPVGVVLGGCIGTALGAAVGAVVGGCIGAGMGAAVMTVSEEGCVIQ